MKMENSNAFQCKEIVLCQERSFIKRETSGTSSDKEWRVTMSGTTIDNECKQVTTIDSEWPFWLILLFFE